MNKISNDNIEFLRTLKSKQININSFLKDLKDFHLDTLGMYPDPKVTAARTYFRMNLKNESDKKIAKKIISENQKYHNRYPHLINTSLLILTLSFFESTLSDISSFCQMHSNKEKKDFSKYKVEIAKFKNEIEYYSSINLNALNESWNTINFYRELRNCLVHQNGNVNKLKSDKLKIKLTSHENILITRSGNIRFKYVSLIENVFILIYNFLETLLMSLASGKLKPLSLITEKETRIRELNEKLAYKALLNRKKLLDLKQTTSKNQEYK